MSDLVAIVYPSEAKAEEVRQRLLKLQKEYLITISDAVTAVKTDSGGIKLNQLVNTTSMGAVTGGFWGLLIGMIFLNPRNDIVDSAKRCLKIVRDYMRKLIKLLVLPLEERNILLQNMGHIIERVRQVTQFIVSGIFCVGFVVTFCDLICHLNHSYNPGRNSISQKYRYN